MSNTPESKNGQLPWFALRVKPNHEKHVSELMNFQGFEEFLPLYTARRKWAQRWQDVDVPLFSGYVFCRFERSSWSQVINTPGVIDVVRIGNSLASVDDNEIEALQLVQRAKASMQPSPFLQAGEAVRVTAGPFAGAKGILVDVKRVTRLVLSVTLLHRSVLVEVDRSWLTPERAPQLSELEMYRPVL